MDVNRGKGASRGRAWAWCWLAVAGFVLLLPVAASAARIDPQQSRFGFVLTTRWGQELQGRFNEAEGEIVRLADGRQQVRLRLPAGSVEIIDSPMYTRQTRGEGFFDARRHPHVSFVSEPYDASLLRSGGAMAGTLSIREVSRREVLQVAPARCDTPGVGCAVVVSGDVRREDYGMQRWRSVIASRVLLQMRVRLTEPAG